MAGIIDGSYMVRRRREYIRWMEEEERESATCTVVSPLAWSLAP